MGCIWSTPRPALTLPRTGERGRAGRGVLIRQPIPDALGRTWKPVSRAVSFQQHSFMGRRWASLGRSPYPQGLPPRGTREGPSPPRGCSRGMVGTWATHRPCRSSAMAASAMPTAAAGGSASHSASLMMRTTTAPAPAEPSRFTLQQRRAGRTRPAREAPRREAAAAPGAAPRPRPTPARQAACLTKV